MGISLSNCPGGGDVLLILLVPLQILPGLLQHQLQAIHACEGSVQLGDRLTGFGGSENPWRTMKPKLGAGVAISRSWPTAGHTFFHIFFGRYWVYSAMFVDKRGNAEDWKFQAGRSNGFEVQLLSSGCPSGQSWPSGQPCSLTTPKPNKRALAPHFHGTGLGKWFVLGICFTSLSSIDWRCDIIWYPLILLGFFVKNQDIYPWGSHAHQFPCQDHPFATRFELLMVNRSQAPCWKWSPLIGDSNFKPPVNTFWKYT